MIVDYYFIRKQQLILNDLYDAKGIYSFTNGFNRAAILALFIGIVPNIPGFLTTIKVVGGDVFPAWISGLYSYAWFVGFGVSFFTYLFLSRRLN